MSKIDHSLFQAANHALDDAFGPCPKCSSSLVIRRGKGGAFIGCSTYPECGYIKPLHDNETHIVKLIEGSTCPECSSQLAVKKGRYGLFIGCTNMPDCHHIESIKPQEQTQVKCPACESGELVQRTNRFGKTFFSCNQFPKCKYAVNHKPVATRCQKCNWGIMLEMKDHLVCPKPDCGHKQ